MTDREKEIEEIILVVKEKMTDNASIDIDEDLVSFNGNDFDHIAEQTAEALYNAGYRKIPDGAVVLTKEEYNDYINLKELLDKGYFTSENRVAIHKARKETAREIFVEVLDLEDLKLIRDMGWETVYNSLYNEILELAKQFGVEIKE